MPSKKSKKAEVHEEVGRREEEENDLLEENDEEEEITSDPLDLDEEEYTLADDAEEKLEALAVLGVGSPAIISSETKPDYDPYPTDTHRKNNVKYQPGDKTLPFNDTLILR